jgi:hypothetical protein
MSHIAYTADWRFNPGSTSDAAGAPAPAASVSIAQGVVVPVPLHGGAVQAPYQISDLRERTSLPAARQVRRRMDVPPDRAPVGALPSSASRPG